MLSTGDDVLPRFTLAIMQTTCIGNPRIPVLGFRIRRRGQLAKGGVDEMSMDELKEKSRTSRSISGRTALA